MSYDIQEMVMNSERHVSVLEELAKEHMPDYEVEKTRDSNGMLGTPIVNRVERQYTLRGRIHESMRIDIVGPFHQYGSEENLRIHFANQLARGGTI